MSYSTNYNGYVRIDDDADFERLLEEYSYLDFKPDKRPEPGRYMIVTRTEPCPRGCCTDSFLEFYSPYRMVNIYKDKLKRIEQEKDEVGWSLSQAEQFVKDYEYEELSRSKQDAPT